MPRTLSEMRSQLVEENMGLVGYVIGKCVRVPYWHWRIEHDDLMQTGYLALCEAALSYEPDKGLFSTYAVLAIKRAMIREIGKACVLPETPVDDDNVFCFMRAPNGSDPEAACTGRIFIETIFADRHEDEDPDDQSGLDILLMNVAGYTIQEIARQTNLTPGQVGWRITNTRKKLKQKYEAFCEERISA